MEINVFGKYKVKRTNNYSYISDRIGEEYYFDRDKSEEEAVISGSELMEWIINDLKDDRTISAYFNDNEIFIEQYSPNGESGDILYTIEPIYTDKEVKEDETKINKLHEFEKEIDKAKQNILDKTFGKCSIKEEENDN